MTLSSAMRASASGMTAERARMDVIAVNLANANSVRVNGQEPYRRRQVVLSQAEEGVEVAGIIADESSLRRVYEPGHELADAEGFVEYTNVEPVMEMVDMISATRAYEANIAAFNAAKGMESAALGIGRV